MEFQSSNPRQHLEYRFSRDGVMIQPGDNSDRDWSAGVRLTAYGPAGALERVTPLGGRVANHTRLDYRYTGPIEEWFINSPFGLEHGFTLHAPPADTGTDGVVVLELALSGGLEPKLDAGNRAAVFLTAQGEPVLSYSGLKAWDATGRELPARMTVDANRLALHVDTAGAEYPVTVDPLFATENRLVSSQPKADGDFGRFIALDGPWLVIGAILEDTSPTVQGGAAYVYQRQADGSYAEYQRLTASDTNSLDNFGISVAISGGTIVIGASEHDVSGQSNAGAAYVFDLDSSGCSTDCWQQTVKLTATTPAPLASFGSAIDIDGNTLVVGAKVEEAAYIFERVAGFWTPMAQLGTAASGTTNFGVAVAVSGDHVAVGADQENFFIGAVYLFNRNIAPGWGLEDTVTGLTPLDAFGFSVGLDGGRLVAGAPGATGIKTGMARVFTRDSGGQWDTIPPVSLQPRQADNVTPDAAAGDAFGIAVGISLGQAEGDYIVASSQNNDDNGNQSGSAYIFQDLGAGGWQQVKKLVASDAAALDRFGNSVESYGAVAVIGAQDKVISTLESGAVYAYHDATDSDGDGLSDQVESQICYETGGAVCTNPGLTDTDGDGVSDDQEIAFGGGPGAYAAGDLDPGNPDSDGDSVSDGDELLAGSNPLDPADTPVYGDINGDGSVNVVDVMLAMRMALGLEGWTAAQLFRGNVAPLVDGEPTPADSVIGVDDVVVIQRWALLN